MRSAQRAVLVRIPEMTASRLLPFPYTALLTSSSLTSSERRFFSGFLSSFCPFFVHSCLLPPRYPGACWQLSREKNRHASRLSTLPYGLFRDHRQCIHYSLLAVEGEKNENRMKIRDERAELSSSVIIPFLAFSSASSFFRVCNCFTTGIVRVPPWRPHCLLVCLYNRELIYLYRRFAI